MTRVIADDGVEFTPGVACLPTGVDEDGFGTFDTILFPSGRSLEYLQNMYGPDIYVIRDPA